MPFVRPASRKKQIHNAVACVWMFGRRAVAMVIAIILDRLLTDIPSRLGRYPAVLLAMD